VKADLTEDDGWAEAVEGCDAVLHTASHRPYAILWLAARFDKTARLVLSSVGEHKILDGAKARSELGWTARPVRESVIDTGRSLIERRLVTP
jgi:nucleoside-diphosphate-sugar epimerase